MKKRYPVLFDTDATLWTQAAKTKQLMKDLITEDVNLDEKEIK